MEKEIQNAAGKQNKNLRMVENLIGNEECTQTVASQKLMHSKANLTNMFYISNRVVFQKGTRVTKINKIESLPSRSPQSNEDLPVLPFNCVT